MCPWHFPGLVAAMSAQSFGEHQEARRMFEARFYCADPSLDRVATDVTQATQSIEQSLKKLEGFYEDGLRRSLVDIDALLLDPHRDLR